MNRPSPVPAGASPSAPTGSTRAERMRVDWVNSTFLIVSHLLAITGLVYLIVEFSWLTLGLAILWYAFCGVSITGGYHRFFAHPTYEASRLLTFFYLCFGAASVQNSALKWAADHRLHHAKTDTDDDPYSIRRGFWWAHIGWVFFRDDQVDLSRVPDLVRDKLVAFQHKHFITFAVIFGAVLPAAIAALWGDWLGGLLVAGFLRLVLQYHATFSVNSVAHWIGKQPYSEKDSARDSWITALITMGEGYHNFHHSFPTDYRNGVRFWQFDPTKWWVWTLSKVGLTWKLRRTAPEKIARALGKRDRAAA